jgi:hypothetical protein
MCQRVECPKCGRPTFVGCGLHVEQVLGNVPKDQRCQGHPPASPAADKPADDKRK